MKILTVADTEERCLWECFRKERFEGVDLFCPQEIWIRTILSF